MVSPGLLWLLGATTVSSSVPDLLVVRTGAVTPTVTVPTQCAAPGQVGSPPPLAVAVLLPFAADAPTFTFKVSTVLALAASVPVNVQDRLLVPLHDQFGPLALASVMPLGSGSLSVMLAVVVALPVLVTVTL